MVFLFFFSYKFTSFHPDSCRCENVNEAQLELSPGRSFELFCLHSAIPKGLHTHRGSSQGWRLSMDVDMAQGFLHLPWSAALSWEPQAAVPALPRAEPGAQGWRWGLRVSLTCHHSGWAAPGPGTDQQHRDNSVGPELLLFSFGLLDF